MASSSLTADSPLWMPGSVNLKYPGQTVLSRYQSSQSRPQVRGTNPRSRVNHLALRINEEIRWNSCYSVVLDKCTLPLLLPVLRDLRPADTIVFHELTEPSRIILDNSNNLERIPGELGVDLPR